ncbi:MAG: FemAB family PEP-CTERM system-associated protein [Candidatus Omnitrophica bacterium]|nr:FemAB family PEP-CTERM system-associated protein [Candidatus Omnitrophota bacterium]
MEEKWNKFVEYHSESTFFHQFRWRRVIENIYGFKSHYIVAKDEEGNIQGILPLFEIKQLTGKKLISVPFSTEGGILYNTEKAKNLLLEQAKNLMLANGSDYLELRQEKDIGINFETKDYYYHLKLNLNPNPEIIWKQMDKKARNAVRKARKLGLTTDKGLHYFEEFYKIFSRNMRDLGTPVDKKEFFEEIIKQFPNQVDIVVAKLNEKVIGAVFLLKHKKTIKSEWASSLKKYRGYNANQLMYWRAIKDACKEGFEIFDFGRSMLEEGTYKFKKKFGAKPIHMHYKYFINKSHVPDIRKTNWKRKVFAKCWSKLPLLIANKLGPKLREQFP